MNETNRTVIVLLAALWIVLMAVIIFVAWSADAETVDRLDDFVRYLDDHRDDLSRLILTLGALVLIVLALLVIIVEVAPEEEGREIRVEQAGATTIVPAEPLRLRLEEALTAMNSVTAAKARVFSHEKGIGMKLDLTVTPDANIAVVTQEASRVVVETLQADLGLPVSAPPSVRIQFGPPKPEPVASSVTQPPSEAPAAAAQQEATPPGGSAIPSPAEPVGTAPEVTPSEPTGDPASEGERPLEVPPAAATPEASSGADAPLSDDAPPRDETQQK